MTDAVQQMPGHGSSHPRLTGTVRHVVLIAICFVMIYPILWMLSGSLRPDNIHRIG